MTESLTRSMTVGSTASAIAYAMRPNTKINLRLLGITQQIPLAVGVGLGTFVGSYAGALAHDFLLPGLHITQRFQDPAAAALSLATVTGANYGSLLAMNSTLPGELGMIQIAGWAIGTEVLGSYIYDSVINPMIVSY